MVSEKLIYKSPEEKKDIIIFVTKGCSNNRCNNCSLSKGQKLNLKTLDEIDIDLKSIRAKNTMVERIFIGEGSILFLDLSSLSKILIEIKSVFTECKEIIMCGTPKDILNKSNSELKELKKLGLGIIKLDAESGSNYILRTIKNGFSQDEIIKAGNGVKENGLKLCVCITSGLGGKDRWIEHAIESAKAVNKINPEYLNLLPLYINKNSVFNEKIENGSFVILPPRLVMNETRKMVEHLELANCNFKCTSILNSKPLEGKLPFEKQKLLKVIDECIRNKICI